MPLNSAIWRDTGRKVGDGSAKIRFFQQARAGSFQARDNVAVRVYAFWLWHHSLTPILLNAHATSPHLFVLVQNFLKWCAGLGLADFILFESNDLVESKCL
jgi:hypothetical protein